MAIKFGSKKNWSPAEEQQALKLAQDGWSYAEIAQEMGRTTDSIKAKLSKLRKAATTKKEPVVEAPTYQGFCPELLFDIIVHLFETDVIPEELFDSYVAFREAQHKTIHPTEALVNSTEVNIEDYLDHPEVYKYWRLGPLERGLDAAQWEKVDNGIGTADQHKAFNEEQKDIFIEFFTSRGLKPPVKPNEVLEG